MLKDAIIEIPFNSFVKYEIDKETNRMRCDRVLHTAMAYPGNYGYFPNTLAGDGDPLDVLVISEYALHPGTIINVKIVGVLLTKDEKGSDEKIIAVPAPTVDPNYSHINDISDIPKWTLSEIRHFFEHYKDTEENKWVEVQGFYNREHAEMMYAKSISLNNLTHSK